MMQKVGMAEAKIALEGDSLRTLGLGSCVGVALYDPMKKIGGLAHVMLPSSGGNTQLPAKYADTAIPYLIEMMVNAGSMPRNMVAKLAGGAQMFATTSATDIVRVGPRNVEAVRYWLDLIRIPVIAEEVGGNIGRTVELFTDTGNYSIRTAQFGEKWI